MTRLIQSTKNFSEISVCDIPTACDEDCGCLSCDSPRRRRRERSACEAAKDRIKPGHRASLIVSHLTISANTIVPLKQNSPTGMTLAHALKVFPELRIIKPDPKYIPGRWASANSLLISTHMVQQVTRLVESCLSFLVYSIEASRSITAFHSNC